MIWGITVDGVPLPPENLEGINLEFDIENVFLKARVILSDNVGGLFSLLKLGSFVKIIAEEKDKKRTYDMRIIGYKKETNDAPFLFKNLEVDLVSDWYYSQKELYARFFGGVSKIISEVLDKEIFFKKRELNIEDSTDAPIQRYCLGKPSISFLEDLSGKALSGISPMYLYMGKEENLNFRSWDSMRRAFVNYNLTPLKEPGEENIYAEGEGKVLGVVGSSFSSSPFSLSSERRYSFPTLHLTHSGYKKITTQSQETRDSSIKALSPPVYKKRFGWEVSPSDAISMSLRDHLKEDFGMKRLHVITQTLILENVDVGMSINFRLPLASEGLEIEEGRYLIRRIEEIWTKESLYSRLTLNKL